ncbi:hypothetical protein LB579_32570 [Mesorhizobium sp. BR1-1-7]|uniref:hypothetical protein n=1 Tax=Mesorhizobium sp. BR1-1-7 TaxID=2876647 RepID=UPI001CCCD509|nr:hypothetical protein [Mesorhizobium sp. BR1-1-7]MBZ9922400.1 hypothetical protein [Mesorhizobium sp. BR1-1-7]
MLKKVLAASLLGIALAGSALAQSNGTSAGGNASGSGGANGGATVNGGASVNGAGTGTVNTDPDSTNSTNSTTTGPNGMNDRCKDSAGNDVDNNTASGATTSPTQNCNK